MRLIQAPPGTAARARRSRVSRAARPARRQGQVGVVSVFHGAREPRPLVIALHGGSEKPERARPAWRRDPRARLSTLYPSRTGSNEFFWDLSVPLFSRGSASREIDAIEFEVRNA
jgi:poly(3-hydroxybutyrate) depolymerase